MVRPSGGARIPGRDLVGMMPAEVIEALANALEVADPVAVGIPATRAPYQAVDYTLDFRQRERRTDAVVPRPSLVERAWPPYCTTA